MRLTLEPWSPEYDTSLHDAAGLETVLFEDVNLHVELEDWFPVQTRRAEIDFERLFFIDGRRRLEAKVFAQWEEDQNIRTAPGLLGTYAVGLAEASHGTARIVEARPRRVLILGGDLEHPGLRIPASGSRLGELFYRPVPIADFSNRENHLEQTLQNLMREAERDTARDLATDENLLIVDGTLAPRPSHTGSLGYVKTLHDFRLPPQEQRTLFKLQKAQRSPVFEIGGFIPRFSWYLRLEHHVEWHQGLSGVVRLEVYAHNGLEWALRVADWSCLNLPRFAAKGFRDPRAPQQLMPVAFLESELGRRMGDAGIVRRRIQAFLRERYGEDEREHRSVDARAVTQAPLFELGTDRSLN